MESLQPPKLPQITDLSLCRYELWSAGGGDGREAPPGEATHQRQVDPVVEPGAER